MPAQSFTWTMSGLIILINSIVDKIAENLYQNHILTVISRFLQTNQNIVDMLKFIKIINCSKTENHFDIAAENDDGRFLWARGL